MPTPANDRSGSAVNPVEIIRKKRDGEELAAEEIRWMIAEFTSGRVADYQMAALAMAIYFQGLNVQETAALTDAMTSSGSLLAWGDGPPLVDKHSTGGIGDKISLILAPALASLGLRVPMISGRGLGITGGTLDKLESIPGFRTDLSLTQLQQQVDAIGCVITGATAEIAPADRRLYALRDVTATVPSIPLITASIMSKKLAEGIDQLVLDVKFGHGAFMKTPEQARRLADSLVQTGQRSGVQTTAVLTDMNQPLGHMVGNAVEVHEAIRVLQGEVQEDLIELVCALGAPVLCNTDRAPNQEAAQQMLRGCLTSGEAYEKFAEMVAAQGGRLSELPPPQHTRDLQIERDGFIDGVDALAIGQAVIDMGGGRKKIDDAIDHGPGIEVLVKNGDPVDRRQPWARLYNVPGGGVLDVVVQRLNAAIAVVTEPPGLPNQLVLETINA